MDRTAESFRTMALIRCTEERILDLFSQGLLFGTTHTCIGQEADAVGIVGNLRAEDIIFSNHRCHGHYLARTGDVDGLIAELMGRITGVCGGVSGSQHLCHGTFFSNGIQGGIVPNAVGMAIAEKHRGTDAITTVFIGDGTLGEGVVYESMNIASLWGAPVLFVVENNGYAQSTPSSLQIAGDIAARPRAFGIETVEIASTDVEEIDALAAQTMDAVRTESRPACMVIHTYRLAPHSKGDDNRDPAEIDLKRQSDPLTIAARRLDAGLVAEITAECQEIVERAVVRAAEAPLAAPAMLAQIVQA